MRKIILLTGLPRSGKTFVKNLLSLSPEIQTTEKEFFFFRYFDDENFDIRGNYEQNIEFLFENCKISKNLQLNRDYFIKNGNDNKDLYQNIIKNYLQVTNSKKKFFLDNSPDTIGYFSKYISWFGDDFKCVFVKRNILNNFASYKSKNIKSSSFEKLAYNFKFKYHHSNLIFNLLKSKYPNNLFEIKFEEIVKDTDKIFNNLSSFLNLKIDKNLKNKIHHSKFIVNSSFNKDRTLRDIDKSTIDRSSYLNSKEQKIIKQKINLIDISFLEKECFELDIKTKNQIRDEKMVNLSNILVNIFYDLKIISIFKSQILLTMYSIKRFLSKFFN